MHFKSWFLTEDILIKWHNEEVTLVPAEGPNMEFHYQWDKGYSSYYIGCYQARRPGYAVLNSTPSHVGIIKTDAIESKEGIDIGFIKNLIAILKKQGFQGIPYREGGQTGWEGLFKKVGFEPEEREQEPFTTGHDAPNFDTGQKNMVPLTKSGGMSSSRATGSWAFFAEARDTYNYMIKNMLEAMKSAAQPLIDNDLIDFFDVVDRKTMQRTDAVYSKKGQGDKDDWHGAFVKAVAQLKYFTMIHLANQPKFKAELLGTINTRHTDWPAQKVEPKNTKTRIEDLYKINDQSYSNSSIIDIFLDAIKSGDKDRLDSLEKLAEFDERKKQADTGKKYPPYWMGGGAEKIRWIWNKGNEDNVIDDMTGTDVLRNLSTIADFLKYDELLNDVEPEYYEYIKKQIKEAIENAFSDEETPHLNKNDIYNLNDIAGILKLNPKIVHTFEQAAQKHKDVEIESKKKQEESRIKQSYLMPIDGSAYMMLGEDKEFKDAYKYINYHGDFDTEKLANDLVGDEEGINMDAIEKAEEDANNDVEERPSETYGDKKEEVLDDIKYDWEEFVSDEEIEDVKEDDADEEAIKTIVDYWYDEFVEWKKAKMKEDEDSESWKYEPDTESHDFQVKVSEYQAELAEEYAWEKGLITIKRDEKDIEIYLHKNHWEKFKPIFKKFIDINLHTMDEDNESVIKASTKIELNFLPNGGETKSAYDWYRELAQK